MQACVVGLVLYDFFRAAVFFLKKCEKAAALPTRPFPQKRTGPGSIALSVARRQSSIQSQDLSATHFSFGYHCFGQQQFPLVVGVVKPNNQGELLLSEAMTPKENVLLSSRKRTNTGFPARASMTLMLPSLGTTHYTHCSILTIRGNHDLNKRPMSEQFKIGISNRVGLPFHCRLVSQ
jgi:hypothetical protein